MNEQGRSSTRSTGARRLHQLLLLGGLGLLVAGLAVSGVFGGAASVPAVEDAGSSASTDGTLEPAVGDDASDGDPSQDEEATTASENESAELEGDDGSPAFEITTVDFPREATVGDTVTVTYVVENRGNANGTATVDVWANGSQQAQTAFTLNPGDRMTVTERIDTSGFEADRYPVRVETPHDDERHWIELATAGNAAFTVSNLTAPENRSIGESIPINYTIRNAGNTTGTGVVTIDVGDDQVHTEELTLAPATSTNLTTDIATNASQAGDHNITVHTPHDSATTSITLDDADSAEDDDPETDEDDEETDNETEEDTDDETVDDDSGGETDDDDEDETGSEDDETDEAEETDPEGDDDLIDGGTGSDTDTDAGINPIESS